MAAALDLLAFAPKKAAGLVAQTLKSAIANAENNNNLRADKLVVQEAVVGEGQTMKRFRAKARGSAGPILKRTSNIRIILTDEIEIKPKRAAKSAGARKGGQTGAAKKSAKPAAEASAPSTEAATE